MGFIFPEFLFGLLLIAIPVVIHLYNFRKFKKVYFTNVSFLKDLQVQSSSSKKLKERLILACRILAVTLLVLAFAQPYFKTSENSSNFPTTVVSFYLDNSYSMEAVNKNGTLLDEGKRKVKDILSFYDVNDKFQLLTNNFDAKSQKAYNKEELLTALDEVKIAPWVRDYESVLIKQQNFLEKTPHSNKSAYLISDFQQQNQFKKSLKKAEDIEVNLVPLTANDLPNISIDSVYFLNPIHRANQTERLVVKVKNNSDKDADDIPAKLVVNKVQKAISNLQVKAFSEKLDTLSFSGLSGNWQQATLSIKDYPITFDDELHFTFELKNSLPILSIYQQQAVYSIGLAYQTDPFFDYKSVSQAQINYNTLASNKLIILQNLEQIADGLSQQLKLYVQNGGSLSVFIPLNADLGSYQSFLRSIGTDLPLNLVPEEIKVAKVNFEHPLFSGVFEQIPKNMDLPVAKSYFKNTNFSKTTAQVLLSRGNQHLYKAYSVGKGKVYISFLPLENEASNFTQHALFLPILFKTALLSGNFSRLFYTVGTTQNIIIPTVNISQNSTLNVKGNGFDVIPSYQKTNEGSSIYFADQINKPGFYTVSFKDSLISQFALNEDRRESVMKFYDANELEQLFNVSAKNIIEAKEKITSQQIKEVKLGSSLWKLCLILVLIFLAAEVLLIRFYKKPNIKSETTKY